MNTQNLTSVSHINITLNENGNVVYKNTDLMLTYDQFFDLRTQLGRTTKEILEIRYNSIIEQRRSENIEILLN